MSAPGKRPRPSTADWAAASSTSEPSSKRTLDAFFPSTSPTAASPTLTPAALLVASDPLTDRRSTFVAHARACTHRRDALALQTHVRSLRTPAHPVACTHEILGYRILVPARGKTGLDSPDDWRVEVGADDDGETGAGAVVRDVLERSGGEGGVDVAVVVSRLYGGVMLGPARFTHIRTVATQALTRLLIAQRLAALRDRLTSLDAALATLASPMPSSTPTTPTTSAASSYPGLTIDRAERLVAAREKRLQLLEKKRNAEVEDLYRAVEAHEELNSSTAPAEDAHAPREGDGGEDGEEGEPGNSRTLGRSGVTGSPGRDNDGECATGESPHRGDRGEHDPDGGADGTTDHARTADSDRAEPTS